jgi:iron complex outermembrane receptor protein
MAQQLADASDATKVGEIIVTGRRTNDGQVSTTSRVGILGDRSVFDTPFATSAYTDKLIADQQARSITDVAANDPSVRAGGNRYADSESNVIRGFTVFGDSTMFNGVANLAPYRRQSLEGIARVEIFKGPNGLLNNSTGNFSVGGAINLVPKRAADTPVTDLTATFISDGEFGGHFDLGRRFGADNAFGIRVNVAGRTGQTPLDNQLEHYGIVAVGFDWRGDRVRASLDVDFQVQTLYANLSGFTIAPGISIPRPPDASTNIFDRSSIFRQRSLFALGQVEYDIASRWKAFASLGAKRYSEFYAGPYSPRILNAAGDVSVTVIPYYRRPTLQIGQFGVRGSFDTGSIAHQLSVIADGYTGETHQVVSFGQVLTTNLYDPIALEPRVLRIDPDTNPPRSATTARGSVALADVVTAFDGRVTLVAGLRYQALRDDAYSIVTGARTSHYDATAVTPGVALLFKLTSRLGVYGNYIEALQSGSTAPTTAANAGEVLPPFRAKQIEVGAKYDFGTLGLTLALFQIEQPSTLTNPATNRFGTDGLQRNRGLELNAFGSVTKGFRLLGGVALTDGVQLVTAGGINDGKTAIGTPKTQINLGGEWDVPMLSGLTLTGRAIYTSRQFYDAANTQFIPEWTRFDLGARYRLTIADRPVTARVSVENVTGKDYWQSAARSSLSLGAPRTLLLSLSTSL